MTTPKLRFKDTTAAWEIKKLTDITNVLNGLTYSPKDIREEGTFVIRSSNVQNNMIVHADDVFVDNSVVNSDNVKTGDVVVVVRNGSKTLIGKHAKINKEMDNTVVGAFMSLLRSENGDFLNALLDTKNFRKSVHESLGATINQITKKDFSLMKMHIPKSSKEIKKIGNYLSLINKLIENQNNKLEYLNKIKKSYLQTLFSSNSRNKFNNPKLKFKDFNDSWKNIKFTDLLDKDGIRRGPFGSSIKKSDFVKNSDYVVYEQQNAIYNRFKTRYSITKDKYKELKNFHLKTGDFIMSGAGTIGKIAKVPNNIKKGVFNQALIRIRLNTNTNPNFFLQLMNSELMQKELVGINPGSVMRNLRPMKEIKNIEVKIPIYSEQVKIGSLLSLIDKQINLQQEKLNKIELLKTGYLQKMFV